MILDDFLIKTNKGYYCKYADFYIDPSSAVSNSVVSHAHADHASPGSTNVYCTQETAAFMQLRYKQKAAKQFYINKYKEPFRIGEVQLTFYSAGHILGSAQILMEYQGICYLYSGDIKLQSDLTVSPSEIVRAHVLITETTFANPSFIHPDPISEILKLSDTKGPVIIGSYVLGKAQRLNALLNEYLPTKQVYIHFDIYPYHKIYERFWTYQLKYEILKKTELRNGKEGVYIVPPLSYESYKLQYPYTFAFASGWDHLQSKHQYLKISDHLDWNDLLEYIKLVNPQEIWAIHGDPSKLIEHFKDSDVSLKVL